MPHKCTNCGKTFPDGSEKILSGCPECGWNKFKYFSKQPQVEEKDEKTGEKLDQEPKEIRSKKEKLLEKAGFSWEGNKESKLSLEELEEIEKLGSKIINKDKEISEDDIESFRLKKDGSYEINLKSLFENEGIIISIGEDGRYVIDLESFLNE
ncbi:hypothetical protein C9439_05950 [archaeon SCG-AAA382B04]|nr:hypothetical protein C9439_05950 [archaeon SCG-AAA382B04]